MPIEYNLSDRDYFVAEGISKSGLDIFRQSPAHYQAAFRYPRRKSPQMLFGSLVHTAVLEPDLLSERYVILPEDCEGRSKAAKEAKEAFSAEHKGKRIVSSDDLDRAQQVVASVNQHEAAKSLLARANATEASVFVKDEHGTDRKSRIDALADGDVIDLKTTHDASKAEFAKYIWDFRYHVQAAFYEDNLKLADYVAKSFKFICVETEPPYAVAVYELDPLAIEVGRKEYKEQLELYRECLEFDSWPAYPQQEQTISLPVWTFKQAA